jgi:hypothetical protein
MYRGSCGKTRKQNLNQNKAQIIGLVKYISISSAMRVLFFVYNIIIDNLTFDEKSSVHLRSEAIQVPQPL